ncbi:IS110 family transposase [Nibrella saemangeumensis]|uniref:IS110 family transposase n=1 Tax=Nibrella saemangeumensis TaxID=1084526 RepID=A0ABP8NB82_9BACT
MKTNPIRQCVGIDISKDQFMASFATLDEAFQVTIKSTKSFANTLDGFEKMTRWISQLEHAQVTIHYVMEATGVYYESLAYWLHEQGQSVSVILPKQFKAYANSLNIKSKTDRIDARVLAQMGLERSLPVWQPASPIMRQLKQLCREKNTLKEEKKALKNQLHALTCSYLPNETTHQRLLRRLATVNELIREVESELLATLQSDPRLAERIENVCTIKGIGLMTALALIAETNGFALFTSKAQLVCYAGYDVVKNESGTSVKNPTKISKRGNNHLRKALHFPALTAIRYEPRFQKVSERITERSSLKMKGVVAVQRKLLVLVYTLFKNNTPFEEQYESQKIIRQSPVLNPA